MDEKQPSLAETLESLDSIRESIQQAQEQYDTENDAWWASLTETQREDAFYAVMRRLYQADVEDQGSYRYALYQVFGFDPGMYGRGMDCGYLDIHNLIMAGLELETMKSVTRLEVIDDQGRSYTKWFDDKLRITDFSLQDENRTLKIFIDPKGER